MKRLCKLAGIVGAVLALAMVIGLGVRITASARLKMERTELLAYLQEQERILTGEVREFLEERGYHNSGVMLTRTEFADGTMEYKLTVHHGRIDKLGEAEKKELLAQLGGFTFPMDQCRFVPVFLDSSR